MQRRAFVLGLAAGLPLTLVGCGAVSVLAPDADVARARYSDTELRALWLFTVRNNGTNAGAHTALLVNASQRVIFDPAGSFGHPSLPERNDVIFGITPQVEQFYTSYHARMSFHVIRQKIPVSPEVAEMALTLCLGHGPVAKANCTRATSDILRQLPGFESIRVVWFPERLMAQVQRLPGVVTDLIYEDDDDDKEIARAAYDALVGGTP